MAVVAAGGIGFEVARYLANGTDLGHAATTTDLPAWLREWGVADPEAQRGGLVRMQPEAPARHVTLVQRKPGKHGGGPGKNTGWIHRAAIKLDLNLRRHCLVLDGGSRCGACEFSRR